MAWCKGHPLKLKVIFFQAVSTYRENVWACECACSLLQWLVLQVIAQQGIPEEGWEHFVDTGCWGMWKATLELLKQLDVALQKDCCDSKFIRFTEISLAF